MPPSTPFSPDAMQFVPCQITFPHLVLLVVFHSIPAFFSLSPLSPTFLRSSISCPPPSQSSTFISTPAHDQKRCTKSIFIFSFATKHATYAKQASIPAWIIYVSIPPGGIYLAQTKEGYWCLFVGRGRKGRCDMNAGTNLSKTQNNADSFFFFLAIAAITITIQ